MLLSVLRSYRRGCSHLPPPADGKLQAVQVLAMGAMPPGRGRSGDIKWPVSRPPQMGDEYWNGGCRGLVGSAVQLSPVGLEQHRKCLGPLGAPCWTACHTAGEGHTCDQPLVPRLLSEALVGEGEKPRCFWAHTHTHTTTHTTPPGCPEPQCPACTGGQQHSTGHWPGA